jgi:hypothetical protein
MITLDTYPLPDGLWWNDEFDWSPVAQSSEYSVEGAMVLEEGVMQAGRPITLKGTINGPWCARSVIEALYATLDDAADKTLILHDGRSITVRWRHPAPIKARPLRQEATGRGIQNPDSDTVYMIEELAFLGV